MNCVSCGKELLVEAKYCSHCGIQLDAALQSTPETTSKTGISGFRAAINSAGQAVSRTARSAGKFASTVATQVGDLNGDGKVDAEDLKIATERAKKAAGAASDEATKLGREALQSDMVKDAAAGAAVGAVIAVPIPLIGPVGGAAVGAAFGVYKNLTKK